MRCISRGVLCNALVTVAKNYRSIQTLEAPEFEISEHFEQIQKFVKIVFLNFLEDLR